jgi:hypothetical protein
MYTEASCRNEKIRQAISAGAASLCSRGTVFLLILINLAPLLYVPLELLGFHYQSVFLITFITIITLVYAGLIILKESKFTYLEIYLIFVVLNIILFKIVIYKDVSYNLLYLLYAISIYYVVKTRLWDINLLLRITNYVYVLYIFLSLLVYFKIIEWKRVLNIFYFDINGFTFKTFIGFYGSTADLDSYSFLIAMLNFFFNKNPKSKVFFVLIGILMSVGTLTATPIVSLFIALFFILLIKLFSKKIIPIITFSLFMCFGIIVLVIDIINSYKLTTWLGLLTNGRSMIWKEMLLLYNQYDMPLKKIFGFGNTDLFIIKPFGEWGVITSNPHNSFLRIAIEFGLIVFSFLYSFITKKLMALKNYNFLLICLFILTVAITNSEIFTFKNPVYILWLYFLLKRK